MKRSAAVFCAVIFFVFGNVVRCRASDTADSHLGCAIGCAFLSNCAVFSFDRFIMRADYAMITPASIHRNLHCSWVWDQDEFLVNHIGHPYQGSMYYTAGRANGIGCIGSSLLTACNSAMWELFFETERPSRNDFISTTIGGIALGEMLHRLSFEISLFHRPISFLVSPVDGFTVMLASRKRKGTPASFRSGLTSFAAGLVTTEFKGSKDFTRKNAVHAITVNAMADIVYGDIFGVSTLEPFSQFEASLKLSFSPSYYTFNLISDGILFGKSIFASAPHFSTLGGSLHYDFIFNSLINFSAFSLGLSYKHRHVFASHVSVAAKIHLNWVALGANDYSPLRRGIIPACAAGKKHRDYDLGTGEGLKLSLALVTPHFGTCEFGYSGYGVHSIPASIPDCGSERYALIGIGFFMYEYPIRPKLSLGVQANMYHKQGFYSNAPDVDDLINTVSIFVKCRFSRK